MWFLHQKYVGNRYTVAPKIRPYLKCYGWILVLPIVVCTIFWCGPAWNSPRLQKNCFRGVLVGPRCGMEAWCFVNTSIFATSLKEIKLCSFQNHNYTTRWGFRHKRYSSHARNGCLNPPSGRRNLLYESSPSGTMVVGSLRATSFKPKVLTGSSLYVLFGGWPDVNVFRGCGVPSKRAFIMNCFACVCVYDFH